MRAGVVQPDKALDLTWGVLAGLGHEAMRKDQETWTGPLSLLLSSSFPSSQLRYRSSRMDVTKRSVPSQPQPPVVLGDSGLVDKTVFGRMKGKSQRDDKVRTYI